MQLRAARLLWLAAIAALALGLVGTCGAAVYLSTDSLEEWTAELMSPGGKLLHAETRERHHCIIYKDSASKLRVAVIHPPHPLTRAVTFGGFAMLGGSIERPVQPDPSARVRVATDTDQLEFSIPPGIEGQIHVSTGEILDTYLSNGDPAKFELHDFNLVVDLP